MIFNVEKIVNVTLLCQCKFYTTLILLTGVEIQPAVSSVLTTEGDSSSSSTGQSNGAAAVEVCLELASGNLQRNVTVNVKSVSSPTPSGMLLLSQLHCKHTKLLNYFYSYTTQNWACSGNWYPIPYMHTFCSYMGLAINIYEYALISTATVTEDYLYLNINITFTSGQNATGDNQQCFSVTILNDDILECNETFDISISPIPEDEDVVNITRQLLTVLIEEDANDCK